MFFTPPPWQLPAPPDLDHPAALFDPDEQQPDGPTLSKVAHCEPHRISRRFRRLWRSSAKARAGADRVGLPRGMPLLRPVVWLEWMAIPYHSTSSRWLRHADGGNLVSATRVHRRSGRDRVLSSTAIRPISFSRYLVVQRIILVSNGTGMDNAATTALPGAAYKTISSGYVASEACRPWRSAGFGC